ncbi:2-dehydropantoate 2-reductase [Nitrospina gracilis]|nr:MULTISPECIES: 2-dehydropantoate 2-reductase [Nitrospina]MCF8722977.1 2-dehydropantoate 2-reductase [Nitrospina sp. Nb-3]
MKILIYGAGAVGLGLASCLMKTGNAVDVVGRAATVEALRRYGLTRTGLFGDFHAPPSAFGAVASLTELKGSTYDFTLVCTKSFDTASAAQDLASAAFINNARTPFVLCQNGWGNSEIFAQHFPEERVKSARVITGFTRPEPHHVDITVHADTMHIGSLFDDAVDSLQALSDAIDGGGLPCAVTKTVGRDLWAKMLYNCMLNGLSTLFDVPYGLLGESPDTRRLMDAIAREVFAVMQAAEYRTHWESADGYLDTFYKKQLPATYRHIPSMLQDLRAGKRTEIDALNGAVMKLGEQHRIPVPHNTQVYHLIRFAEAKRNLKA